MLAPGCFEPVATSILALLPYADVHAAGGEEVVSTNATRCCQAASRAAIERILTVRMTRAALLQREEATLPHVATPLHPTDPRLP